MWSAGELLGGVGLIESGLLMASSVCRFVVTVDNLKSSGSNLGLIIESLA